MTAGDLRLHKRCHNHLPINRHSYLTAYILARQLGEVIRCGIRQRDLYGKPIPGFNTGQRGMRDQPPLHSRRPVTHLQRIKRHQCRRP